MFAASFLVCGHLEAAQRLCFGLDNLWFSLANICCRYRLSLGFPVTGTCQFTSVTVPDLSIDTQLDERYVCRLVCN